MAAISSGASPMLCKTAIRRTETPVGDARAAAEGSVVER
jgi:hypothetical protein